MSKIICISSEEDDDIWEYKSQSKSSSTSSSVPTRRTTGSKRKSVSPNCIKQEHDREQDIKPEKPKGKTKKKKFIKESTLAIKEEQTPSSKIQCPVCQMPFSLLSKVETPSWHMDLCLMQPYSTQPECTEGKDCKSTIASHYQKFRHTQLARSRRKSSEVPTQKGDIASAKVKLQFDQPPSTQPNKSETTLLVPDRTTACTLSVSSTSPVSNSHRSDKDVYTGGSTDSSDSLPSMDLLSGRIVHKKSNKSNQLVLQLSSGSETEETAAKLKKERRPSLEKSDVRKLFYGPSDDDTRMTADLNSNGEMLTAVKIQNFSCNQKCEGSQRDDSDVICRVDDSDLALCTPNNTYESIGDIFDFDDEERTVSQMLQDAEEEEKTEDSHVKDDEKGETGQENGTETSDGRKDSVSETIRKLSGEEDEESEEDYWHNLKSTLTPARCIESEEDYGHFLKSTLTPARSIDPARPHMTAGDSDGSVAKTHTREDVSVTNILANKHHGSDRTNDKLNGMELDLDDSTTDSDIGFFARKRREHELGSVEAAPFTRKLKSAKSIYEYKITDTKYKTVCIEETHLSSEADDEASLISCKQKSPSSKLVRTKEIDEKTVSKKSKTDPAKGSKRTHKSKKDEDPQNSKKLKAKFGGQKSLMSYFRSIKQEDIVIQTDSNSSDDCARMNSDGKCCINCTATNVECTRKAVLSSVVLNQVCQGAEMPYDTSEKTSCANSSGQSCVQTSKSGGHSGGKNSCEVTCYKHSLEEPLEQLSQSPEFLIEGIRTVSQNTFSKIGSVVSSEKHEEQGGGFCSEDDEDGFEEDVSCRSLAPGSCAESSKQGADRRSPESDNDGLMNFFAEKVNQIRKNAADILMASSKFLYRNMSGVSSAAAKRQTWSRSKDSVTSDSATRSGSNSTQRQCPFYKRIPGTNFTVDAFQYGAIPDCNAYFLSHFHYDHFGGLTKTFRGNIYCSQITANLVCKKLGVDRKYVHPLPLNTSSEIDGVSVTLLEANHCPGAVLLLFRLKTGKVHLHTGDFRASRNMEGYPELCNRKINTLFLDTTYCDPQYVFPSQEEVIRFTVNLAKEAKASNPDTLIVCGSYTIGKERMFSAISEALDCKICVTGEKFGILQCLEDPGLLARCAVGWRHSGLHVVPMNKLNYKGLKEHVQLNGNGFTSVLALEPTGWTQARNRTGSLSDLTPKLNRDGITLYGVPYSEHSSFLEMKRFVQFIRPERILPTVNNGNVHSRKKMEVIFETWKAELSEH